MRNLFNIFTVSMDNVSCYSFKMKKITPIVLSIFFLLNSCSTDYHMFNGDNLNLRTTFEETADIEIVPELNKNQKLWLVALPAIIMLNNKSNLESLEVEAKNESTKEHWLKLLNRDWGINSRDDLLDMISRMEYSGHNDSFLSIKKFVEEYNYISLDELLKFETLSMKQQKYYSFILNSYSEFKNKDLIAWDLGRMTSLIRWGYQVGFLTENESWNMMLYFGNKIKQYYNSWDEYGEAYQMGRIFWASGFGKEELYRSYTLPLVSKLLAENGLWSNLKWNIKLPAPKLNELNESEVNQLNNEANEIDNMYNVSARAYKKVFFDLGNYYLRNSKMDLAQRFYKKGLRLDSKNWEIQLRMAKIDFLNEDYYLVLDRLEHLERNCNDAILLSISDQIKQKLPQLDSIEVPPDYDKVLLLHSYDYIPDYIISALKSRIGQEFKIKVWSGQEKLDLSEEKNRSSQHMFDRYIERITSDYLENRKEEYSNIVKILNLNDQESLSLEDQYTFVQYLYNKTENGKKSWPNLINNMTPQYNAQYLRMDLKKAYSHEINKPNVVGVLGITSEDIFSNDYNFLFGLNGPKAGVMSINRFSGNDVALTTFIKRSVNQAFSSTGFIIGIPRCTVSNCSRAYPNSLEEHDQKEDSLCIECKTALKKLRDPFD